MVLIRKLFHRSFLIACASNSRLARRVGYVKAFDSDKRKSAGLDFYIVIPYHYYQRPLYI